MQTQLAGQIAPSEIENYVKGIMETGDKNNDGQLDLDEFERVLGDTIINNIKHEDLRSQHKSELRNSQMSLLKSR